MRYVVQPCNADHCRDSHTDSLLPVIPDELTYGGAILLLTDAMKTIADCNHDKRAIREFEQMRASGAESNKENVL
ncbi:hypothetical protein Q4S30_19620 [Morganella morganii]